MLEVSDICSVIARERGDAIVVACQSARKDWFAASTQPELDILFRGAMGKGSSLGLGLALARPERKVIVLDGDGSLLMNLGTLVTIMDCSPTNLHLAVLENGTYSGTGGQAVPGQGKVAFEEMARAASFPRVERIQSSKECAALLPSILATEGPTFTRFETREVEGAEIVKDDLPKLAQGLAALRKTLAS